MGLIVLGTVISLITTISGSTHVVLDTVTTTLSIAGMFLLIHKNLEAWYLWIVADILYVILFLQDELYLSSLVYFVFAILAYFGYKNWKKQLKNGI
jgi:nicotinamide mononucleotide transporter